MEQLHRGSLLVANIVWKHLFKPQTTLIVDVYPKETGISLTLFQEEQKDLWSRTLRRWREKVDFPEFFGPQTRAIGGGEAIVVAGDWWFAIALAAFSHSGEMIISPSSSITAGGSDRNGAVRGYIDHAAVTRVSLWRLLFGGKAWKSSVRSGFVLDRTQPDDRTGNFEENFNLQQLTFKFLICPN